MKSFICLMLLTGGMLCATGCKTEINNPPANSGGTTVIREDHVHDSTNTPPVQNNIKVDR